MKENSIAKNSLFFVLYKLFNVIFPLVIVAYASNIIKASGIGKVASAQNIVQYFTLAAALGIPNYGIREIAKIKCSQVKENKLFSELFTINCISTFTCVCLYYFLVNVVGLNRGEKLLYNLVGITVVLNFFNVDWYYQGNERYSYITIRSFLVKAVSLVAALLFVKKESDYILYACIYLMGIAGNNLINFFNLKKCGIRYSLKGMDIRHHFKPVFFFLCTTIAIELYTMVDTTMLTFLCTNEIVGYYTNSMKVVKMIITLVAAIGGVLLPRLSYYHAQGRISDCTRVVNQVFSVIFFLFMPCGIGIFIISDSLIPVFFGNTFLGAIPTLKVASLLIYALGFSNLFGTQVLLTFNDEKHLLIATIMGGVSNIILNSIMIPLLQQNGAVIASVISEFIVTITTFIFARKYLDIRLEKQFVIKTLIATLIMTVLIIPIKNIIHSDVVCLFVTIMTGVVTYTLCSYILKNSMLLTMKSIIIGRSIKDSE